MKNNEMKSDKENRTKAREKLIEWLDKYSREENSTFIFEDGNCDELKNFNSSFNDIYYMLYGENATKHHKSGKRTIPESIIKKLIEEFCLPYRISFDGKKGNVKKIYIEKVCEE